MSGKEGHPNQCRGTLEALQEYVGGAKIDDGLSAAQEYPIKFKDDVAVLVVAERFEPNGSVLLRASDVQRMRAR